MSGSVPGFILLDSKLNPLAVNDEARRILTFPNSPEKVKNMGTFIKERIQIDLMNRQSGASLEFVREFQSGRRRYVCRAFRFPYTGPQRDRMLVALLLERVSSPASAIEKAAKQYELTERECQAVELLTQGLTSKEIADRMQISANTVKAFLRTVMAKMGVTTRSGVVGRLAGPQP